MPPLFISNSVLLPLLITAGILMILGFHKAASGIVVFIFIGVFLPIFAPLLNELISTLPGWAILLLLVFFALQALRFVLEVFLGKEAAGYILANIVSSRITWIILALLILSWYVTVIGSS